MICETKADRGLSYLDAKQYEKALAEFTALKADGWASASEGVNLTYYVWGNDLAKKADYVEAYEKLAHCTNYKDTAQIRTRLKENIYKQGQSYYLNGNYTKAKMCFNIVENSYSRASDYLLLISMHSNASLTKSDVQKLIAILSFEDAKTIIMREKMEPCIFLKEPGMVLAIISQ